MLTGTLHFSAENLRLAPATICAGHVIYLGVVACFLRIVSHFEVAHLENMLGNEMCSNKLHASTVYDMKMFSDDSMWVTWATILKIRWDTRMTKLDRSLAVQGWVEVHIQRVWSVWSDGSWILCATLGLAGISHSFRRWTYSLLHVSMCLHFSLRISRGWDHFQRHNIRARFAMMIIGKYGRPRGITSSNILIFILSATSLLGSHTLLRLRPAFPMLQSWTK